MEGKREASSGLDERLRDAVARAQEFSEAIHEVIMSWQRKPRNERFRRSGTDRLDQWNVKNTAEHTSRIELGVMLASLAEVAQTSPRVR